MPDPIFVDLSHWNPEPEWQMLKSGGVLGVILKATESTGYVDPTFQSRRNAAVVNDIAYSTYHFLKHGAVDKQMAHYLRTVSPVPGERMILDYEDAAATLTDLRAAVSILFGAGLDLQVSVYSGHLIKDQLGNAKDELLAKTSLWIAQYTSAAAPSWPKATWPNWTLWQYTDKATVTGISKPVDGNRFNGSTENALKWLNPATTEPEPGPSPGPKPEGVYVEMAKLPEGVGLKVGGVIVVEPA